jgi:hypothetical protein
MRLLLLWALLITPVVHAQAHTPDLPKLHCNLQILHLLDGLTYKVEENFGSGEISGPGSGQLGTEEFNVVVTLREGPQQIWLIDLLLHAEPTHSRRRYGIPENFNSELAVMDVPLTSFSEEVTFDELPTRAARRVLRVTCTQ